MRRGPQQIDIAGAEQVLQHRNAGITGREVRVVGEGDRQRTWGTWGKLVQIRDIGNSVGKNTRRKINC